ncbi:MAG: amidinotransferase [bacterium]|nr:amidinotransferase [bacterium]
MYGRLRRVLVRPPGDAFASADPDVWHYTERPDAARARDEHERFVALLEDSGAVVEREALPSCGSADALYTHDPGLVVDDGAIVLRMGKPLRAAEPAAFASAMTRLEIPLLHALDGEARAEGGDVLWLDERTLAVGLGFRTNEAGLEGLASVLAPRSVTLVPVPLPWFRGPEACLHLMSAISVLDRDLALVHLPLLPATFVRLLESRGFRLVRVAEDEFDTMAPNVLAVGPRDCVAIDGNPETRRRLEAAGCRVRTYVGREISLKAEGGPTCLTRPLLRDAAGDTR